MEDISSYLSIYRGTEKYYMSIVDFQANGPTASIENANGLFVDKNLKLKKDFEMVLKRMYNSEVKKVDFKQPKHTAEAINGWVNAKTKGLIPSIVDDGKSIENASFTVKPHFPLE